MSKSCAEKSSLFSILIKKCLPSKITKADKETTQSTYEKMGDAVQIDAETTDWLSHIIQATWPAASEYAPRLFEEYMEPSLAAQMPGMLPKVHFSKVTLGKKAPRIESMRVLPDRPGRLDIVCLEADFVYDGDIRASIRLYAVLDDPPLWKDSRVFGG